MSFIHMPLTEEETDAELEKVQQNITRTLQAIDQNFERCNQTITGTIIPEVEKFIKASQEIWEHSKTWLHFFQMQAYGTPPDIQEQEQRTNRPPFTSSTFTNTTDHFHPTSTRTTGVWERLQRDLNKQRNHTFEHSTPGTDSMKGLYRPSRIVDRRNVNVARSLHQQIHNSDDITTTNSSSMYAPTVRLLGIDDDIDSINNSSNNDHTDTNIKPNDDHRSTMTRTPTMKSGTPIHAFNYSTTPAITTNTTTTNINEKRKVDKEKSVDTSSNSKKPRYAENPMLQPSDDITSTQPSSMHAPTARLLGVDGDIDSISDGLTDTNINPNDDHRYTMTRTPTMKSGTPIHAFNYSITPAITTTTTTTNINEKRKMDKGKSVDTSSKNEKPRYGENPMLHPPGSANRSTLMDRLEEAKHQTPLSSKDESYRLYQHNVMSTPGSSNYSRNNNSIANKLLANTPTMERLPKNYSISSKQNLSLEDETSNGTKTTSINPRPPPFPYSGTPRRETTTDTPSSSFYATPMQRKQDSTPAPEQLSDQQAPSPFRNDDMDMAYEFSPIVTRQAQDDNAAGSTPQSLRSYTMTGSTNSMITMVSGVSGQIPAKFSLEYFSETFHEPPASSRLTTMYNLFADRPGQLLYWRQVVDLMRADAEHGEYARDQQDSLRILLSMLTRKRFLRRIDIDSWILRS